MRLFNAPPKRAKKKTVKKVKRACEDSTQRKHAARSALPFGRPAK
jgi:hypothetical protein